MSASRQLPTADADSAPFWEACRDGRLSAQKCPACGKFRWPAMRFCPSCHREGGDWIDLPGTGEIRSFVVAHRAFDPAFEHAVPYVIAHVALDGADGVTIIANVTGKKPENVAIGQRVTVELLDEGSVKLPQFRPA